MTNAKKELLKAVENTAKIKCAWIAYDPCVIERTKIILKLNYNNDEYNEFLSLLNFDYDSGYGRQELYGTVWWKHIEVPEMPFECIKY